MIGVAAVRRVLPLTIVALLTLACSGDPTGVEPITKLPRALSIEEERVIEASNGFAFDLLRQVRADSAEHNTFLAPLSVSMALGMTMNGAAGETWTQMRDVLHFDGMEETAINQAYRDLIALLLDLDPSVEIGLGNSLWADASRVNILESFRERVRTYFDAEAATLDFDDPAAKDVMNEWVADVTNGRIDSLITDIPDGAALFLINAIYFNGDWRTPFEKGRTTPGAFTRADGTQAAVEMMDSKVGYRVLNAGNPSLVQGVELPYGGGAFTAVALLPPEGQSIDTFLAGLDDVAWRDWMSHFDAEAEAEDLEAGGMLVRMPKFELKWKGSLVGPLKTLGMTDAFGDGAADLSRINGQKGLVILDVLHNTFVKLDEEGTEAAGATAVIIGVTSAPPSITFDRPFLFAIRERHSGTILFMGVIGDPSDSSAG